MSVIGVCFGYGCCKCESLSKYCTPTLSVLVSSKSFVHRCVDQQAGVISVEGNLLFWYDNPEYPIAGAFRLVSLVLIKFSAEFYVVWKYLSLGCHQHITHITNLSCFQLVKYIYRRSLSCEYGALNICLHSLLVECYGLKARGWHRSIPQLNKHNVCSILLLPECKGVWVW